MRSVICLDAMHPGSIRVCHRDTILMAKRRDEIAFLMLCKAVENLGILMKRMKKSNELLIKRRISDERAHLGVFGEEGNLQRHITIEPEKGRRKSSHVLISEIPPSLILRHIVEAVRGETVAFGPGSRTEEELADLAWSLLTREPMDRDVRLLKGALGNMLQTAAQGHDKYEHLRGVSKLLAEFKRLPRDSAFETINELEMQKKGYNMALTSDCSGIVLVVDGSRRLEVSFEVMRRMYESLSVDFGWQDLNWVMKEMKGNT